MTSETTGRRPPDPPAPGPASVVPAGGLDASREDPHATADPSYPAGADASDRDGLDASGVDARRVPPLEDVPGHVLLDQVAAFVARYVAFPDPYCLPAVILWAAHTWAADAFYTTPRLVLDSAEPGSGKTRVLELLALFVRDAEMVLSPTTAAIFRMLSDRPYTLLFDETDAIFNSKNAGNYEDLRALLNAGYKRTATIPRCVGDAKSMKVQRFKVFAPVALAGLAGAMPATITTRSVTVHMRKRAPNEHVEPYEEEDAEAESAPLRDALAAWTALPGTDAAVRVRPLLPAGVVDRAAEVWRPLVAVADAAGGAWPELARAACRHFVLDREPEALSLGVRLLADLRTAFDRLDADKVTTADLLRELHAIEDAPWSDLYGKPLDARRLARELDRYEVRPTSVRTGTGTLKGYQTAGPTGLADAWTRYLPAAPDQGGSGFSRNSRNSRNIAGQSLIALNDPSGTAGTAGTPAAAPTTPTEDHVPAVPAVPATPDPATPPLSRAVPAVPAVPAKPRPAALVQPADASPLPARAYGPCRDCGQRTQRYGPGGNARCPDCRTSTGTGGAENVIPLHRPGRTEGTPA